MANEIQELKFQVGEAWKGVYSSSIAYGLANVVQDPTGLSIYRSLKSGNVGHPLSNSSWWFRIIDLSSIKAESDRIVALNQAIAQDEALRVAAEELRQQHEAERVAAETQRDEAEQARISAEQQRVNKESQREAKEQQRITAEQDRVSAESARVQAEQARVLAETLRANAEDQRAANEQNRVAAEQQRIERAEQDHQRAESDHATYVDSLGAFDISSYHATDGVLAKYADLTAALGTNGENIPDDLRKGGMSVKFVQSSDNKYVQARLMADSFTTDVTQWQGVDDEPVSGSKNLVESGGIFKKIVDDTGELGYINGNLIRGTNYNFKCNKGDSLYIHFEGDAGSGIRFLREGSDTAVAEYVIPSGETVFDSNVDILNYDVSKVLVIYGNITNCVIKNTTQKLASYALHSNIVNVAVTAYGRMAIPMLHKGTYIKNVYGAATSVLGRTNYSDTNTIAITAGTILDRDISFIASTDTGNIFIETCGYADLVFQEEKVVSQYSAYKNGGTGNLNLDSSMFEIGNISSSGDDVPSNSSIRSKIFIRVYSNDIIAISINSNYKVDIHSFDINGTWIGHSDWRTTGNVTLPSTCYYIRPVITNTQPGGTLPDFALTSLTLSTNNLAIPTFSASDVDLGHTINALGKLGVIDGLILYRYNIYTYNANRNDKINISIKGTSNTGIAFLKADGTTEIGNRIVIPEGETYFETEVSLTDDCSYVIPVSGNIEVVSIIRIPTEKLVSYAHYSNIIDVTVTAYAKVAIKMLPKGTYINKVSGVTSSVNGRTNYSDTDIINITSGTILDRDVNFITATDTGIISIEAYGYADLSNKKHQELIVLNRNVLNTAIQYSAHKNAGVGNIVLDSSMFEKGNISGQGQDINSNISIRSKICIRAYANDVISISISSSYKVDIHSYDVKGSWIRHSDWKTGGTVTLPKNCYYIRPVITNAQSGGSLPDFNLTSLVLSTNNLAVPTFAASDKDISNVISALGKLGIIENSILYRYNIYPLFANKYDKIQINIKGTAGTGVNLIKTDGTTQIGNTIQIPNGETSISTEITLTEDCGYVQPALDNIEVVSIRRIPNESQNEQDSLPIYAPSPQLPANGSEDSDFNAETLTPEILYNAYDALLTSLPSPGSGDYLSTAFGSKSPVEAFDSSNQFKMRTYVFTKRNRYAWKHANKLYAWKDDNDNVVYIDSCSPRVGDIIYSDSERTNSGKTVSSYNSATQSLVASDTVSYTRYNDGNIAHDVYWSKNYLHITGNTSSTTLALFDREDESVGNATYVDDTHILLNGKSYERCEDYDYHTDTNGTIFLWGNEHCAQSDPNECAITLYRLAKDICSGCRNNDFLSYIKKNYKVVIIPAGDPYAMNAWATSHREGRNNYNEVNINRNYDTIGWPSVSDADKGSYAGDQNETQYIMNRCLDFNSTIAIDCHCLGYKSNILNQGRCHYSGYITNIQQLDKLIDTMLGYGLECYSYGRGNYNTHSDGDSWIHQQGISGGLIEMNAGDYALSYDGHQHGAFLMEANYTLLLNAIKLWM